MQKLEQLIHSRTYRLQAFEFVLLALDDTMQHMRQARHVNGHELLLGIQRYAKAEFGPMAKHVLNSWGIYSTRDLGEIVFELVEKGVLRKTEEDNLEDFVDSFDFEEVFERSYYQDHPVFQE